MMAYGRISFRRLESKSASSQTGHGLPCPDDSHREAHDLSRLDEVAHEGRDFPQLFQLRHMPRLLNHLNT